MRTTEMRMLRWARGNTRLDHVRNVHIWKEAHMYPMAEFLREKRLSRFGHVPWLALVRGKSIFHRANRRCIGGELEHNRCCSVLVVHALGSQRTRVSRRIATWWRRKTGRGEYDIMSAGAKTIALPDADRT